MGECYYSYSFNLDDGLIMEEVLDEGLASPMRAVGLEAPLDFDDFIDVWKNVCHPIFENEDDEQRLTRSYFKSAYGQGEKSIFINLEHNPLKSTFAAKYTRINIELFEDKVTHLARATVMWEDNPQLKLKKTESPR